VLLLLLLLEVPELPWEARCCAMCYQRLRLRGQEGGNAAALLRLMQLPLRHTDKAHGPGAAAAAAA